MHHIAIISPSGAIDPVYIHDAAARLREWGHQVIVMPHAEGKEGRFAGSDKERTDDICRVLEDKTVDMVLCARGGYGLQRIIHRLPNLHKPVIGFSDITCLHQLAALSQQPTIHGIMCKHIATLSDDAEPLVALRDMLDDKTPRYEWTSHPLNRPGRVRGHIIGGNLSVLYGLQGTPYSLQAAIQAGPARPILLIEDIAERHYHIDRMLCNLRMSGVLSQLGGLIVGQFSDCDDDTSMGETIYETIARAVADYDYPVVFNAPIGHVEHNLPLWLNTPYSLCVDSQKITLEADPAEA